MSLRLAVPLVAGDAYGLSAIVCPRSGHDNGNVHRAAAKIIVSKSRAARGSVCNVLLSRVCDQCFQMTGAQFCGVQHIINYWFAFRKQPKKQHL